MKLKEVTRSEFMNGNSKIVRCGFDADIIKDEGDTPGDNDPIVFAISTAASDRMSDTIAVDGWATDNFAKNPVILWAHDKDLPPIGKATSIWTEDAKLMSRAQFTPKDMPHPLGDGFGHTVGRMFREGFLNAVSVGFAPESWTFNEITGGIDFVTQELLEFSAVPIPANPEALQDAGRKGFDTAPIYRWCEHALDTGEHLVVPRKRIEEAYVVLKGIHGTSPGTKIEVDVEEAVGIVEKIKRWVSPAANKTDNGEEEMKEEITELLAVVKDLVTEIKASKEADPVVIVDATGTPIAEEAPEQTAAEAVKEFMSDPDTREAIAEAVRSGVEKRMNALQGRID